MIHCKDDYIGKKFNHLTIIKQVDDYVTPKAKHKAQFLCECDCNNNIPNQIVARLDSLKSGHTSSCGCVKTALTIERNNNRKTLLFEEPSLELNITDENHQPYGRFKLNKINQWVYFSMSDYELIKNHHWYGHIDKGTKYKSVCAMINGTPTDMHRVIGMYNPDHVNRNSLDNRRENLDNNASKSIQVQNRKIQCNNKSGCKGVGYVPKRNKWVARLKINHQEIYLGSFKDIDDAIIARLKGEQKYFDKRAWQIELMEKYKCL